jgi:hypothetical protein
MRYLPQQDVRGPINNFAGLAGAHKEKAMTLFRPTTRYLLLAATALALAGCGGMMTSAKPSNTVTFKGTLSGANEVPPKQTAGTGSFEATLNKDTYQLHYHVVYSGLSGPATAGHFHGPAAAGANAGVVVPFKSAASPIDGDATLTPAQAADLLAGLWYVNIHTAANPGGEIRGQVTMAH